MVGVGEAVVPTATQQEFTGDSGSPAAARAFAKAALGELITTPIAPELCDDVELVVSELVTNAVRAGSPTVRVEVLREGARVTVRVTDKAAGWPEEREAGIRDTGGRGLPLVSAVSSAWGVRLAGAGKVVWADVDIR